MYVHVFRFAEIMVMISFIVLALTWLTKKPGFFTGWIELMPEHDLLVVVVYFIFTRDAMLARY